MTNQKQEYDSWDDSLEEDRQSGRSGSGKKWSLLWRPSEAPTKIHLSRPEKPYIHPISGKALPFRASKRHFLPGKGKRRKGAFLECGVDRQDPCVTCAYDNPAAFGLVNVAPDASLGQHKSKVYYGVSGWIEEEFHLVDVQNNEGEGTHKERWRCLGRGCEHCATGWPVVFGTRFYMEISPGQWRHSFHDLHKNIENSACKCGGTIYVPNFTCGGCNEIILDVSTRCDCGSDNVGLDVYTGQATCGQCKKSWSAFYTEHQKIYEESNEVYKCRCGNKGLPNPTRLCSTEGCAVDPYGVFDCQLTIRMTGDKKEKRLVIDDHKIQEPDVRLFDVEWQGADEWAPKMVEAHQNPVDLDYLLKTPSPEEQCKVLGKPNPFNAVSRGAARYAKYNGDGEAAEGGEEQASSEAAPE
jgi:hypothetical protein